MTDRRDRVHREHSIFPDEAKKAMMDPKFLWALVVAIFVVGSTYALLDRSVSLNSRGVNELRAETQKIAGVESAVDENADRLDEHAKALNWIGSAVQQIADAGGLKLPERPIVNEE